ncbi:MAG: acyl-CoA/acyl-ACP dehydrogenase [Proteobacteria bacterium]|nr:acyl-CoA/acyl-ACP dehydrogenase [Pseudomonadota bacterium]
MDYFQLKYGLFADAPDLVDITPGLGKLKEFCPQYVAKAEEIQKTTRKFAKEEILPRMLKIDEECGKNPEYVDWDLWRIANREKISVAFLPEKMGGLGANSLGVLAMMEELCSACFPSAMNIILNNFGLACATFENNSGIVMKIIQEMVEAQRQEKRLFWAWAITEPSAGTDVEDEKAMATMKPSCSAEKVEGGYRLNGTKCFISNGSLATYVIATICLDPSNPLESMATFMVPSSSEGFSVGSVERKCGMKASLTAELIFKDVFVPEENLWAPPGQGMKHTKEMLSTTRGFVGTMALGIARSALERCIQFAHQKKIKSHRLIDEEWVQIAIADMMKDIMAVRATCMNFALALDTYHIGQLFEKQPMKTVLKIIPGKVLLSDSLISLMNKPGVGESGTKMKNAIITDDVIDRFVKEGSAVKVAGTDLAMNISSRVLDIVGLEGMSHRYGIEKCFRDAKITQIFEGTNQVNRLELFNQEFGGMI